MQTQILWLLVESRGQEKSSLVLCFSDQWVSFWTLYQKQAQMWSSLYSLCWNPVFSKLFLCITFTFEKYKSYLIHSMKYNDHYAQEMRCNAFPVAVFPSTGVEGSPAGLYLWADQAQSYFPLCLKVYICEQTAIIFSSLLKGGSGRSHTRWSADLGRSASHISTAARVGWSLKIRTFEIWNHSINNLLFTNRDDTRMRRCALGN